MLANGAGLWVRKARAKGNRALPAQLNSAAQRWWYLNSGPLDSIKKWSREMAAATSHACRHAAPALGSSKWGKAGGSVGCVGSPQKFLTLLTVLKWFTFLHLDKLFFWGQSDAETSSPRGPLGQWCCWGHLGWARAC
jgi:hypothetical protein